MFTAVLLLVSVGAAFYFLAGIAEIMLDGRVRQFFRRRKRVREIHKLKDHHLVCGYGRIGFVICREFRRENHPYTVIKNDPEKSAQLIDNNIPIVVGDATSYATLIEAGVEHAMRLISSMPTDGKTYSSPCRPNASTKISSSWLTRSGTAAIPKLQAAGANRAISPYTDWRASHGRIRPAAQISEFLRYHRRIRVQGLEF
jgi:voltage-gated potassium channel